MVPFGGVAHIKQEAYRRNNNTDKATTKSKTFAFFLFSALLVL
jgi:hypothetical protein